MNTRYRTPAIVLGVLLAITFVGSTFMLGIGTMMPGMMRYAGTRTMLRMGGWTMGMGLMWLTMFAFWGALLVGIVLLVKWLTDTNSKAVQ